MISYETKKDVFKMWFLKRYKKREISRSLKISRGSVDKIIGECQKNIVVNGLTKHDNLEGHVEDIVLKPCRRRNAKPYKVNQETIEYIKTMVQQNEKNMRIGSEDSKTTKELFHTFKEQKKFHANLVTNISLDSFYKYVRKIKEDIKQNGLN